VDTLGKDYDAKVLQWRDRLAWLERLVAITEVGLRRASFRLLGSKFARRRQWLG